MEDKVKITKAIKVTITFLFLHLVCVPVFSQDIIYTNDGRELKVTIVSIEDNVVKYKSFDSFDGMTRNMQTSYIDFIKYKNGTIERFTRTFSETDRNPTLDFLNRKYESNLALANFGDVVGGLGLLGLGIGLVALISDYPDVDETTGTIISVSSGIAIVGLIIMGVGTVRAKHYYNRIQQLSIIVTPNQQLLISKQAKTAAFNLGVRLNF